MKHQNEKGQSLVEMAIITPLLLLMFLGVFEVGYALRNDLIVINTAREAARYATKGQNIVVTNDTVTGYEMVVAHAIVSASDQLPGDLFKNDDSALIVSNIIATVTITDCANNTYRVIYPSPDRQYMSYKTSDAFESKLDFAEEAVQIGERHRDIVCRVLDENGQPLGGVPVEHVVIVELFYTHHQLLGVPLLSNYLTDPIPIYSKTVMRKVIGRDYVKQLEILELINE